MVHSFAPCESRVTPHIAMITLASSVTLELGGPRGRETRSATVEESYSFILFKHRQFHQVVGLACRIRLNSTKIWE